jgi:ferritin-like metal-binding protein YciE
VLRDVAFHLLKKSQEGEILIMNTMTNTHEEKETAEIAAPSKPLYGLFLEQLAEMHSAESQMAKALPLVAKAAQSEDLKALLELHLKETQGHVATIEQIAGGMGENLAKKTSYAMRGMLKEAVVLMVTKVNSPLLDTALIAAAQKIEHYEIASYGTLCAWARELGYPHELALLTSTLKQEKHADMLLTGLATGSLPLAELIKELSLEETGVSPAVAQRAPGK